MHATYRAVTKELEAFFFFWKIHVKDNFFGVNFEACSRPNMYTTEKFTGHTNSNSSGDKISF